MGEKLTRFADGEGYINYAWSGMTDKQRYALFNDSRRAAEHHTVLAALRRHWLTDEHDQLTERGEQVREWAREQGVWEYER